MRSTVKATEANKNSRSTSVQELPLAQLVLGKAQIRTRELEEGIPELAANIRKIGVLQPILVRPSVEEPGKYEIILGQRRYLASIAAGKSTIPGVVANVPDTDEAKVLSLSENLMRQEPSTRDYIDACTHLFHKYGDVELVAKQTGLPEGKVRLFIKYDRLSPELKALVDQGEADVRTALKVQDVVETKQYEPDEAVKLATRISKLPEAEKARIISVIAEQPEKVPVDELLTTAKSNQVVQIVVSMSSSTHKKLKSYAGAKGLSLDNAGRKLIEAALKSEVWDASQTVTPARRGRVAKNADGDGEQKAANF